MEKERFEVLLKATAQALNDELASDGVFRSSKEFENRVRELLVDLGPSNLHVDFSPHPHVFPDIELGEFGIEVKFTAQDTWRSIANSVLESRRSEQVKHIYLLFGKMGGDPEVRWGTYEQCVVHVRTSHVPRFEVEMYPATSLFDLMGVSYADFSGSPLHEKMRHIRENARSRLKPGERLWWLEAKEEPEHSLPLEVRLYMHLPQEDKRRLRAEAALLCPQIVKPSRTRNKYNDAVQFLLTYHGVLCPQARDLFSAGSVALRSDSTRGGNYVQRALKDIEHEMLQAALDLEDALFVEYWGESVAPGQRVSRWLRRADELARDWQPSAVLFTDIGGA